MIYTGFVLIMLCFFIMLTSFGSLQSSRITRFAQSFADAVSLLPGGKSIEPGKTMLPSQSLMVDKHDRRALLFKEITEIGRQAGLSGVEIRLDTRGVVMTLADKLLFASGDAYLTEAAVALLDKVGGVIGKTRYAVEIGGHTDNRPIHRPAYPSNWELSTSRAVNVLRYLIDQAHIDDRRISAVGYGEYQPLVSNATTAGMARNRRVEIVFKID